MEPTESAFIVILVYFSAAFVNFVETNYSVIEPASVEVGIELIGNLSFPVNVMVEVNFTTASGISLHLV